MSVFLFEGNILVFGGDLLTSGFTVFIPPSNAGVTFSLRDFIEMDDESAAEGAITQITHRNADGSDTAISFPSPDSFASTGIAFDDSLSSVTVGMGAENINADYILRIDTF